MYIHIYIYIYNIHIQQLISNQAKKQSGKTQHVLNTKSCKINNHMKPNLNKAENSQPNAVRIQKNQKSHKNSSIFKTKNKRIKKLSPLSFF